MSRRRRPTALAEPPWTYAPKEVMDWLSSGPERVRAGRVPRSESVTEIIARCSPAEAARALRRFDRLVVRAVPPRRADLAVPPLPVRKTVLEGRFAGVRVRVVVRPEPSESIIKLGFRPSVPLHRARRLLTELGIGPQEAVVR